MAFLTYKEKQLPLAFDYIVLKRTALNRGLKTLSSLAQLDFDDLEILETLCFYSLERGHKIQGIEFNIVKEDIEEILSLTLDQFFNAVQSELHNRQAAA